MSYNAQNPNGQATSANSSPVVLASDQPTVSTDHAKTAGTTTSINNGTTDAGTQRVTLSSDSTGQIIARGNVASGSSDSGNPVKVGGVYNSAVPTLTTGQRGDLQLDASGNLKVATATSGTQTVSGTVSVNALPAGTNNIGTVGLNAGTNVVGAVTLQDSSGNNYFTTTADPGAGARGLIVRLPASTLTVGSVNLAPAATGGWSVSSQTALTSTATVSSAAGKFAGYMFLNTNNGAAYIQVFDTTGAVTLGTTVPTFVVPIPAGGAANVEFTVGITIANGIKIAATTTAMGATTVTTALTGFVLYK